MKILKKMMKLKKNLKKIFQENHLIIFGANTEKNQNNKKLF